MFDKDLLKSDDDLGYSVYSESSVVQSWGAAQLELNRSKLVALNVGL